MNLVYTLSILATILTPSVAFVSVNNDTRLKGSECNHVQARIRNGAEKCRGVNFGGWLVAEHWMTADAAFWQAVDQKYLNYGEYISIKTAPNPDTVRSKLADHHATFITEADIQQIVAAGLNTVRVPVGYWIVGFDNYDSSNQHEWKVFTQGTIVYLDRLIRDWAKKHNVAVLVDLHAAKGSQNGADHSSPTVASQSLWSQYPDNVANSIDVVRFLAERYLNDEAFLGIGLLNEPGGTTDEKVLYEYYKNAYRAVRSTGSNCILSVMPMLQKQSPDEMVGFMSLPEFSNVWVEWHSYFVSKSESDEQLVNVAIKQDYRERVTKWNSRPAHNRLLIGEWSMASFSNLHHTNRELFYKFVMEQLKVHELADAGWMIWSFKVNGDGTSDLDAWSLQKLLTDPRIGDILRSSSQSIQ